MEEEKMSDINKMSCSCIVVAAVAVIFVFILVPVVFSRNQETYQDFLDKMKERDQLLLGDVSFLCVRPALVLAVLIQESDLGRNVGRGNWQEDMRSEDRPLFRQIMADLGYNLSKPVSSRPSYGWGGAMGPAQFRPQTWLEYKSQVEEVTGQAADPYNIRDAFLAAALKLNHDGGCHDERKAVMKYFAGRRWNQKRFQWYGRQVIRIADNIEDDLAYYGLNDLRSLVIFYDRNRR